MASNAEADFAVLSLANALTKQAITNYKKLQNIFFFFFWVVITHHYLTLCGKCCVPKLFHFFFFCVRLASRFLGWWM
jgi:hypothetical protein